MDWRSPEGTARSRERRARRVSDQTFHLTSRDEFAAQYDVFQGLFPCQPRPLAGQVQYLFFAAAPACRLAQAGNVASCAFLKVTGIVA